MANMKFESVEDFIKEFDAYYNFEEYPTKFIISDNNKNNEFVKEGKDGALEILYSSITNGDILSFTTEHDSIDKLKYKIISYEQM